MAQECATPFSIVRHAYFARTATARAVYRAFFEPCPHYNTAKTCETSINEGGYRDGKLGKQEAIPISL